MVLHRTNHVEYEVTGIFYIYVDYNLVSRGRGYLLTTFPIEISKKTIGLSVTCCFVVILLNEWIHTQNNQKRFVYFCLVRVVTLEIVK